MGLFLQCGHSVARVVKRPALAVVVCTLLATFAASTASAQVAAGSVTALTGTAQLQRGTSTSNAAVGMQVQIGDRLTTEANSSLTITLTDASKLELGESSALAIDEHVLGAGGSRVSTKVSLFSGLVHSFVNLTATGAPNFEVHTPNAVAAARATDYATGYEEGVERAGYGGCNRFTDIAVYHGTTGISQKATPNIPEVPVPEGYETTVPCSMPPLAPGPIGMTGASSTGGVAAKAGGGGAPAPIGAPPPACPSCL